LSLALHEPTYWITTSYLGNHPPTPPHPTSQQFPQLSSQPPLSAAAWRKTGNMGSLLLFSFRDEGLPLQRPTSKALSLYCTSTASVELVFPDVKPKRWGIAGTRRMSTDRKGVIPFLFLKSTCILTFLVSAMAGKRHNCYLDSNHLSTPPCLQMQPKCKPPTGLFQPNYVLIWYIFLFCWATIWKSWSMRLRWAAERDDEFFRWKSEAGTR